MSSYALTDITVTALPYDLDQYVPLGTNKNNVSMEFVYFSHICFHTSVWSAIRRISVHFSGFSFDHVIFCYASEKSI